MPLPPRHCPRRCFVEPRGRLGAFCSPYDGAPSSILLSSSHRCDGHLADAKALSGRDVHGLSDHFYTGGTTLGVCTLSGFDSSTRYERSGPLPGAPVTRAVRAFAEREALEQRLQAQGGAEPHPSSLAALKTCDDLVIDVSWRGVEECELAGDGALGKVLFARGMQGNEVKQIDLLEPQPFVQGQGVDAGGCSIL